MKANELRLGNFIQWISTKKVGSVEKIETVGLNIFVNDVDKNDCSPIPITEEWLKRFGFFYYYPSDEWRLKGENEFYLNQTDGGFIYDWDIKIQYIHQLQNLYFALTGEELKPKEI